MASMLKLGGSSSISSRTFMLMLRVAVAAAGRDDRAARRASVEDETDNISS